jgi:hypothetical protein
MPCGASIFKVPALLAVDAAGVAAFDWLYCCTSFAKEFGELVDSALLREAAKVRGSRSLACVVSADVVPQTATANAAAVPTRKSLFAEDFCVFIVLPPSIRKCFHRSYPALMDGIYTSSTADRQINCVETEVLSPGGTYSAFIIAVVTANTSHHLFTTFNREGKPPVLGDH